MGYLVPSLWFIAGVILIIKCGDWFVDAAGWLAEVSGIPKFIVGATVVSLATTLPEVIASSVAAFNGNVDIAIGNAVGSVIANTGLIMGISVTVMPLVISRKKYMPKMVILVATSAILWALCSTGYLNMTESLLLFGIFLVFIAENIMSAKRDLGSDEFDIRLENTRPPRPDGKTIIKNVGLFIVGAAGIVVGANLLVDNGSLMAKLFGVPDSVIAATLIAVGTSLPELVTTISALRKKQASLSVGNIVGANIINLTMILPISAFISGGTLMMNEQGLRLDLPFCFAVGVIAFVPTLITGRFRRWQGLVMLATYAAYLIIMLTGI